MNGPFVCGHGLAERVEREVARGAGQPREDGVPQPLAPGGAEALEVAAGALGTEMSRERLYVMSYSAANVANCKERFFSQFPY